MAVPAIIRPWQFQVGQIITAKGTTLLNCQGLMFAVKQSFVGAGAWTDLTGAPAVSAGNWVVRGSSNGAGAFGNNDNVDRWPASTNLIWAAAGSNHSWTVIEQAGIPGAAGNFQVCIDLSNATQYLATIAVSPSAGFAAGTATARPTAADETVIINNTSWGGPNADNITGLHVLKTSDGKSTRIIAIRSSSNATGAYTVMYWAFELPDAISAWTNPSAAIALAQQAGFPVNNIDTVANLGAAFNTFSRTPGGTNFSSKWTEEGTQQHEFVTDSFGSDVNQICLDSLNDEAPMIGIGLWSATVGARGRNGALLDIRAGLENTASSNPTSMGRSYPEPAPTRQWQQFGDFIQPWNRSVLEAVK